MSLSVSTDTSILSVLKEFYGEQEVENLLFRNSPVLMKIRKLRVGGKSYPLPMVYSRSGAVGSDFTKVTALAANNYGGRSMQVVPGQLFSAFVLDPKEFLSSQNDRAAFISIYALKAFASMEGLRKVLASCLYRSGYLEIGTMAGKSGATFTVDPSTAMALDIGSVIYFALDTASAARAGGTRTVTKIEYNGVAATGYTITVDAALDAAVTNGDMVFIDGGRDVSLGPNAPVGLDAWLPTVGNRTGAGWTTYIGTSFFGVDRSIYPIRLAGNFVLRNSGGGEKYNEALTRLIKDVRRNGGNPDMIVVNDDDYQTLISETNTSRTLWQSINTTPASTGKNTVTNGISNYQFAFSTNFLQYTFDDPFCPKGKAYVLDSSTVMLLSLSNAEPIQSSTPAGNDPGAPKASSQGEPTTNYQFLVDEMYSTTPVTTSSGDGIRVSFNLYGSFIVTAPGHNGVCVF
jgi:hypothetical protein